MPNLESTHHPVSTVGHHVSPDEDLPLTALVIVGGGPTAHAALTAYRGNGGAGRVVLVSEDDHPPYNRPPLSKDYLRGESDEQGLALDDPDLYRSGDTELLLDESVISLDGDARRLRARSGREIRWQQCILATGAEPATADFPGAQAALPLRWLRQARVLREAAQVATTAVVIGSGFIGCEAAASLAARGLAVTMVSRQEQPQLDRLGPAAAELISGWLTTAGVDIRPRTQVARIDTLDPTTGRQLVTLSDGSQLPVDLVVSAVGITPRGELAAQAGASMDAGRVVVDAQMRTSVPGLFAAGDVAAAFNVSAGRQLAVEHWGEAERMGEIAGVVAAGGHDEWSETPGFWSEIGDHTLKYAAWGDGYDAAVPVPHDGGGLTVWYSRDGAAVGVLTSEADQDYDRGGELVRTGQPVPAGPA